MGLPGLRTHRKFRRLLDILRIPEAYALGHLQMLWETSWDHLTPEMGDATDVELSAGWVGEPGALASALVACGGSRAGFIEELEDGRFIVHDWAEHAPAWVKKKLKLRGELAAAGKTVSDVKREAGQKGAAKRWQKDSSMPSEDGKRMAGCHSPMANDGRPCPSPPLPSLPKEEGAKAPSSPAPRKRGPRVPKEEASLEEILGGGKGTTTWEAYWKLAGIFGPGKNPAPKGTARLYVAALAQVDAETLHRKALILQGTTSEQRYMPQLEKWLAGMGYLNPDPSTPTGAPNGRPSTHHRTATDQAYIEQLRERDARRAPQPPPLLGDDPELEELDRMFASPPSPDH